MPKRRLRRGAERIDAGSLPGGPDKTSARRERTLTASAQLPQRPHPRRIFGPDDFLVELGVYFQRLIVLGDLDLYDLLKDDDTEHMILVLAAKKLQNRFNLNMWRIPMAFRVCIPLNRALGHVVLMQDYFAEVPTNLTHLF
ncbi:hypothetical protein QYE76_004991 [Lolium multiflorum]|uniref:Uncharacterized protein n=1 Tax=Lolium multiflorum TaxID=4521 RepID=A0AAD8W2Z6_LOLMU|nr:hypothetical protein QYE76_004991 [Lolium multiflorum]